MDGQNRPVPQLLQAIECRLIFHRSCVRSVSWERGLSWNQKNLHLYLSSQGTVSLPRAASETCAVSGLLNVLIDETAKETPASYWVGMSLLVELSLLAL
jgi:hypothetical protein